MTAAAGISRPVSDWLIAAVFVAVTSMEVWVFTWGDPEYGIGLRVTVTLLTVVASVALAFRRTHPGPAVFVNGGAVIGAIALGFPSDVYQWTNLVAIYSVAAYGSSRERWAALPVGVGGVVFYFARFPYEGGWVLAALVVTVWIVAWLMGRMYGARLEEVQLRHERDMSRRLAEAHEDRLTHEEERNRIARELHDIIGHSVNVMVVHAGGGRRALPLDAETAARALATIEKTGRDALAELDRVLAVLRRDESGPELDPSPGVGDLHALVGSVSRTGLAVDLEVDGDPADVPASVGLSTYRIVQEALTNTLKHAGARSAAVSVVIGEGRLRLTVTDDGIAGSTGEPGRGIAGMRERAELHGGSLRIDQSDRGSWVVSAELTWESTP